MSKMHCFRNNFQKSRALGVLRPQRLLTFNIDDLKLHDLAKLRIFLLILKKSNFKKLIITSFSGIIIITLPKNVIKLTSQIFPFCPLPPIKTSGYA